MLSLVWKASRQPARGLRGRHVRPSLGPLV